MTNALGLGCCIGAVATVLSLGPGCHSDETDGDDASSSSVSSSGATSTASSSSSSSSGSGGAPNEPVMLAEGRVGLQSVRVAGHRLVWTEFGDGTSGNGAVMSCSVDGCASGPTPIASAQPFPSSLVVDATTAYWTDRSTFDTLACPLEGPCTPPSTVITGSSPQWDIAVDAESIYFAFGDDEHGSIRKCALTGCEDSSAEVFAAEQNRPQRIAVSEGALFWTNLGALPDFQNGQVLTCPSSGCVGAPTIVASSQTNLSDVVLDATHVYWSVLGEADSSHQGAVLSCPRSGCDGEPTVVASGLSNPAFLAVDESGIYFSELGNPERNEGRVASCPLAGCTGAPNVYATEQGGPRGIATDATSVYWVNGFDGRVMKASK